MKITVNLTMDDLWQGNKYIYLRAPKLRANLLKSVLGTPIGLAIALLILRNVLNLSAGLAIAAGIIGGCLINLVMIYAAKGRITRKSPGYTLTQSIEIKNSGYSTTGSGKNSHTSWRNVVLAQQNKDYIFFVTGDNSIQIIPKREFETADKAEEFYNRAVDYWKAGKGTAE